MKIRYFPWRMYRRFWLSTVLLLNAGSLAGVAVGSYVFDFGFYSQATLNWIQIFVVFSLPAAAVISYRYISPLRRVLLKALRIADRRELERVMGVEPGKDLQEKWEESLFADEPGEYFELEVALDRIRKKLKKRRAQLAHEREESQVLMSALSDAVLSVDLDGKVQYSNARFAAQFIQREQAQGEVHLSDVIRTPEVLDLFRDAQVFGKTKSVTARLATQMSATARDFSIVASPMREEKSRRIYGVLGVFHDVTELKQAERFRMEFVENASHELRTPLTSIRGYLSMLKEDFAAQRMEQIPQFLETLTKSADRLEQLVADLMTLSALETHGHLELSEVDPAVLTQEVLERLSPIATQKRILLVSQVNLSSFRADAKKIDQVLVNLIENAVKYIPDGGRVDVIWETENTGDVVLRVRDNGPGIPEEHQARLFERFYRVDRGRSRDVGGSGLGLAIVKHIIQAHGGQVSVVSALGQGTEFVAKFPPLR